VISLRTRLIAIAVVLVVAALVAADAAAYASLRAFLSEQANRDLAAASGAVAKTWGQGLEGAAAVNALKAGRAVEAAYVILDPSGSVTAAFPASRLGKGTELAAPVVVLGKLPINPLTQAGASVKSVEIRGTGKVPDYLVTAYQTKQEVVAVGIPLDGLTTTLEKLVQSEAIATVAVIGVMLFASMLLIGVGLRPLTEVERTASAISSGDLTRRVRVTTGRTEIGRLGLAINAMLDRIEQAFAAERAADARLRQLVTDAAHELRTPLTSLRGYAELFRRGAATSGEDLAASMRGIEEESQRLASLVDDLLLLARLDEGAPTPSEPVDLVGVVRSAIEAARAVEPERPIAFEAPVEAFVLGDRGRLRQVADNRLANVRVHTPARAPASVVVTAGPSTVALEVSDQGPGLAPDVRARVFERFYRVDPARSHDGGGAGLGLSIVAAIAGAHGGSARALASEDGAGATFRIELPAADRAVATRRSDDPAG
jgi:two-component system, OmpR family, sensor kinase